MRALISTMLALAAPAAVQGQGLGANLERFDYPFPVRWFETQSQGGPVRMAYLDVAPTGPPKGTVVLLHGKNFCAATWEGSIRTLSQAGYRVIAPDQIGFCKSSKPAGYQYSVHALATLTRDLLGKAGADKVVLVGHSTGGILAVRFALLYPQRVASVVLVNPLGLNDTIAEGAPYADLGTLRSGEERTSAQSIKDYQLRIYYGGAWKPEYDRWVDMLAGQYASPDGDVVRDAQARLSDMIQTQPVAAELGNVRAPVTLIIGGRDLTAFRANSAPPGMRERIKAVPAAAEDAVGRFANARLIRMPLLGHSPQVESPDAFHAVLLDTLAQPPSPRPQR